MNLHRGRLLLVFPTGASIIDGSGLLEGNYADGRRLVTFSDKNDVLDKKAALQEVIRQWLRGVEK